MPKSPSTESKEFAEVAEQQEENPAIDDDNRQQLITEEKIEIVEEDIGEADEGTEASDSFTEG